MRESWTIEWQLSTHTTRKYIYIKNMFYLQNNSQQNRQSSQVPQITKSWQNSAPTLCVRAKAESGENETGISKVVTNTTNRPEATESGQADEITSPGFFSSVSQLKVLHFFFSEWNNNYVNLLKCFKWYVVCS